MKRHWDRAGEQKKPESSRGCANGLCGIVPCDACVVRGGMIAVAM